MNDATANLVLWELSEMRADMAERFDSVDARLNRYDEHFDKIEGHLADLRDLVLDLRNAVTAFAG